MRSRKHRAIFEIGGVAGVPATIGIARPMDYNNKTLYQSQLFFFDPRDDVMVAMVSICMGDMISSWS